MSNVICDTKDWKDAKCSICMEYPHNAVLLICSSHQKGCRPFMCDNGPGISNCYEQFWKSRTNGKLSCPSCRGQINAHSIIDPARNYLNAKKRVCSHEACDFEGTYGELMDHARKVHPRATPSEVDKRAPRGASSSARRGFYDMDSSDSDDDMVECGCIITFSCF